MIEVEQGYRQLVRRTDWRPGDHRRIGGTESLLSALQDHLRVGDAVLAGGRDVVSRIIQIGSRSPYSHVALVTGRDQLTEAYDYALTPDESDEGIYTLSMRAFVERSSGLQRLRLLRPVGVDRTRVVELADHLRRHSPGFPSMGMLCLAMCGLSVPVLRMLPPPLQQRMTMHQVRLTADGTRLMHCGEAATRIYHGAGLPLRFRSPRLFHHLQHLGRLQPPSQLLDLPTIRREAVQGQWPKGRGFKGLGQGAVMTVRSARKTWRERAEADDPVDVADLILPGDFVRAEPFSDLGEYVKTGGQWAGLFPATIGREEPEPIEPAEPVEVAL